MPDLRPNPSVNTDTRRRGFARAAVAGYLTRWASEFRVIAKVDTCRWP